MGGRWQRNRDKRIKKRKRPYNRRNISNKKNNAIDKFKGFTPSAQTKTAKSSPRQQKPSSIISQPINHNKNKIINLSDKMNTIINKKYDNLFYFSTTNPNHNRTPFADVWQFESPNSNNDEIIKAKIEFLLKTNNEKNRVIEILEKLKNNNIVSSYKQTNTNKLPQKQSQDS